MPRSSSKEKINEGPEAEPGRPTGESTGYIAERLLNPYFEVKCITHRKNPVFPPYQIARCRQRIDVDAPGGTEKKLSPIPERPVQHSRHCRGGFSQHHHPSDLVIKMKRSIAPRGAGYNPATGKMVIAVDEDIEPRNLDSLFWRWLFACSRTSRNVLVHFDPHPADGSIGFSSGQGTGKFVGRNCRLLCDAHRRHAQVVFPVSLPKKKIMERAKQLWERLELPKLKPQDPWFGYNLGLWSDEDEEEAQLALKGKHYQTGEKRARDGARRGSSDHESDYLHRYG